MMKVWYINRGKFAIPELQGKSAEVIRVSSAHVFVQFDDMNLPAKFTHGATPLFVGEVIAEVRRQENDTIVLDYYGKRFVRRVRNGKFIFRKVECEIYEPNRI